MSQLKELITKSHIIQDKILNGKLLAIDPSTGSDSSMPGYALYVKGQLTESGIIQVNPKSPRSVRLFEISRCIREDFPSDIDVLAVEFIPMIKYGKRGMNSISLSYLQRAIGAILASRPFDILLEVATQTWMKYRTENYRKTDEYDAIMIGLACINIAKEVRSEAGDKKTSRGTKKK